MAVIGAGPAGATAARLLADRDFKVVLLDASRFPRTKPCAGWLNLRAADLLKSIGVPLNDVVRGTIDEVVFFNGDLSRMARPQIKLPAGYLVDRSAFDARLVKAAKSAGVDFREQHLVTRITPHEQTVDIGAGDNPPVTARMLLIATGLSRKLLSQVGIQPPREQRQAWSAHVEHGKSPAAPKKSPSKLTLVLGVTPETGFCMAFEQRDRVSLTLDSRGEADEVVARLQELSRRLAEKGHISFNVADQAAGVQCIPAFGISALEMESHVGKHTLVIGDAGGFFAAVSHEGIYPAMWSARIATDVLVKARDTKFPQDTLNAFDTRWRLKMAEFIRPPNTEVQLLLPLVFTNQPMADRMAAAFFSGENI